MKWKCTIIGILLVEMAFGKTIVVGPGNAVRSLRQAVALAANGDTILVQKGTYREGNIIINKSVCLLGAGYPVLDGAGKNEILTVSGNNIIIRGIHFANAGYSSLYDYAAIKVIDAKNITIENNIVSNACFAIHFSNTTHGIIRNNRIKSGAVTEQLSGNGIHAWKCSDLSITGNRTEGHRDGIYFEFVTNSVIRNNISTGNIRYGLHFMFSHNDTYINNVFKDNGAGVAVMFSNHVIMRQNRFDHNWGPSAYGILLKEISDSHISSNVFVRNSTAIHMEGTNRITIERNQFNNNGWAIRVQASCSDNNFHHNNFQGNTFDIATNGTAMLNKFYNNYWDKYEGYDLNKDGIGDVPYHPVSLYSMVIEHNPTALLLLRSFIVSLLDKAEKAIPGLTPEALQDQQPFMKPLTL